MYFDYFLNIKIKPAGRPANPLVCGPSGPVCCCPSKTNAYCGPAHMDAGWPV